MYNLRHDMRVYWLNLRVQIRAATMLRGAFITQVLGMIFNNGCFLGAWLFFFNYFGTVRGWSATDFAGLAGVQFLVYGVVSFLVVGLVDLPRHVDSGSLDSFLTKPVSVLANLASSNVDITTIGDMLSGLALVVWYMVQVHANFVSFSLFCVALFAAAIIFFCFAMLLPSLLAFYIFDSEKVSRYAGVLFIDLGLYPVAVLGGAYRALFFAIFPVLLFAAAPAAVLHGLHADWVLSGFGIALVWLVISLWLFKRAIRKYESANLVGAR